MTKNKYIKYGLVVTVIVIAGVICLLQFNRRITTPADQNKIAWVPDKQTLQDQADAWTLDKQIIEGDEGLLPTYYEFFKQVEQVCPYYKPSGFQYRECLGQHLEQYDQTVSDYSNTLINHLNIYIAELKAEQTNGGSQEELVTNLGRLQASWKPYRDALCDTELGITYGGNDQSAMNNICKLYQDELYYDRLQSLNHEWIDEPIQVNYKATDKPIKTKAFEDLTHHAGVLDD